jgi:hypothetical protein
MSDRIQLRDDRDFPLLLTCWDLDGQREVDYRPWMRWCYHIFIFVGNQWYHADKSAL